MTSPIICPLCKSHSGSSVDEKYCRCSTCQGTFLLKIHYPGNKEEREKYEQHNNEVHDIGYRKFVSPITNAVLTHFGKEQIGLDFGAGTGPVISKVLQENGYSIKQYDPFFFPFPELLQEQYDYLVCCEVMEHFFDPAKEFEQLKRMLKPGGALFCMTHIYDDSIDFASWYYRKDPTHVFIYKRETLEWIKNVYEFSKLRMDNRLIELWN